MGETPKISVTRLPAQASAPETQELLSFAAELGMDLVDHSAEMNPDGRRHTLLLLDLISVDPSPKSRPVTSQWRKNGGEALVICGSDEKPRRERGPRYRHWLTPREQLRHLWFRDQGGPEALIRFYAKGPQLYAEDRGESAKAFGDRVQETCGSETDWEALWEESLEYLAAHGYRDLDDVALVSVPDRFPLALVVEAAVCIGRAHHRWWRSGAIPEAKPLVVLHYEGDELGSGETHRLLAALEETRIYLPKRLSARLEGIGGTVQNPQSNLVGLHFDKEWHPVASGSAAEESTARERNGQISQALSRLLIRGRPLRHYGCTFFFPFDPGREEEPTFEKALAQRDGSNGNNPEVIRCLYPCRQSVGEQARNETQARLYFLPHIRGLLFEPATDDERASSGTLEPLREWRLRRELISAWKLELYPEADPGRGSGPDLASEGANRLTADVESVRLFRYFNGTYLLALRVVLPELGGNAAAIGSESDDWWHALVWGDGDPVKDLRRRRLSDWLCYTRLARILYPSFVEQHEEHKIASVVLHKREDQRRWPRFEAMRTADYATRLPEGPGQGLSPIVRDLLACFFGPDCPGEGQNLKTFLDHWPDVYDDRMFVNVAYALAGPPQRATTEKKQSQRSRTGARAAQRSTPIATESVEDPLRRLFSLALFVDRFEDACHGCDGYAYDSEWVKGALDASSLGMWDATGVYAGFTDIANVHLGATGFFAETVARRHVPYIYERMLIQALFYQASLRRYNREIAAATDELGRSRLGSDEFRRLRARFIDFTNRYWFHELTPQMQGRRIFELQQKALGLDPEYELIKDEMERADEYVEANRNSYLQAVSDLIGKAGLFIAIAALWISALPLIPLDGNIGPLNLWEQVAAVFHRWPLLFITLAPPILLWLALWPLVRRRLYRRSDGAGDQAKNRKRSSPAYCRRR